MNQRARRLLLILILLLTGCGQTAQRHVQLPNAGDGKGIIHIYSARHYNADRAIYDAFENKTGIKVVEVKGTAEELVQRMKREAAVTEAVADLFVAVDGGVLQYAKEADVLQPIDSEEIIRQVPARLRDSERYWVGIASRARAIAYAKDRVKPEQLSTYEALTGERWRGKVLVRSSGSPYNQSLLASFIALNGEQAAENWARGIVKNLAREPSGGDRDQIQAIAKGIGDVALVNTYYLGQMLTSGDPEEAEAIKQVGIYYPNQQTNGTHLNISGIGLAKHSPNKKAALSLIAFIVSKEGQSLLAQKSFEFPVHAEAEIPEFMREWGEFRPQELDFALLSQFHQQATEMMQRAGWK
ncbi:extracellular solute-binding protein [Cohnella sp. LGH]|uniref:extracellular solute-binding protein n=1 Tax=Cohnella sp. LGH TaxID=1619153 RepID=UPI001ADAC77B|nr:extracellular solute-binding protein [Cohnella sp. LGH]QTH46345.1 extracellular solute-binding protein [Cohnella sp. LGH]